MNLGLPRPPTQNTTPAALFLGLQFVHTPKDGTGAYMCFVAILSVVKPVFSQFLEPHRDHFFLRVKSIKSSLLLVMNQMCFLSENL